MNSSIKGSGYLRWLVVLIIIITGTIILTKSSDTKMKQEDPSMMNEENEMKGDATESDSAMMEKADSEAMKDEKNQVVENAGSYEAYRAEKVAMASDDHKVILFFRAAWCPTCRALDADIRSHTTTIPEDVTILDVDYDNANTLKQKYGVTYQHTLVQVDANGDLIRKWSGSPTLAALVSQVQ